MIQTLRCAPLAPLRFPLVERFYKANYPTGKPKKNEIIWTLENQEKIIGAVRFKNFGDEQLLTGFAIDVRFRGLGLGHFFIEQLKIQIQQKPCYCFAYTKLERFYENAGFYRVDSNHMPELLKTPFASYVNKGKNLISMQSGKN